MTTSDSIDRVFSHALATVRRLPRTGSSRPPPAARLRLYGLYKQSMEGDVDAILPRPALPPPSPSLSQQQQQYQQTSDAGDQTSNNNHGGSALTRYGSRQLRTREAQAEIEKWDAWHACKGMSRTAAKKAYIRTLIETMKEYASGTQESRELVGELEFVWRQVSRRTSRSDRDDEDDDDDDDDDIDEEGYGETEDDSPRRSGLVQVGTSESLPQGRRKGARSKTSGNAGGRQRRRSSRNGGMTLLSPMGQSEADGSVVRNEEVSDASDSASDAESSPSPSPRRASRKRQVSKGNNKRLPAAQSGGDNAAAAGAAVPADRARASASAGDDPWRLSVEAHLRHLSTEIAALREQLASHYLLAPSGYSPYVYQHLSFRWRLWYRLVAWVRWAVWLAVRQALVQLSLLGLALLYGRWKGDRRLETWLRERVRVALSWARRGRDWRWLSRLPFG